MMEHRSDNPVNIVLFMLDQLSAKWLEAARAGATSTPNIDRLTRQGVTFSRAISSNPLCCPARATLATGLTTRQHGVLENGYELDEELPTFMRRLQNSGWRTGCFGKLHLHPHFTGLHPDYTSYGFDVTHITEDPRGGEWLDWVAEQHPEHLDAALATIWPTSIPEFADYGPEHENLRERIQAVREDFDWTSPDVPDGDWGHYALPFPAEIGQTEWITRHALDFIRQTAPDKPLFAQVSYVQPHGPFNAPAEYFDHVDDEQIPMPVNPTWPNDPHHPRCWDDAASHTGEISDAWRSFRRCYFADIAHLDAQLGRICDVLEETGRAKNTVIMFLADHGEMLFDHGLRSKGNMHYDACIRVPMIMSGPGMEAGLTCDEFVQLEDIFPTVLDLAGLEAPEISSAGPYLQDEPEYLPGQSIAPLYTGAEIDWPREHAYAESYNNITASRAIQWARTVRTERYRYTWFPGGTGEQLFDLQEDPDEQRNLVAGPDYASVRAEMREMLLNEVVLQDYPHTQRNLFALGVH